MKAALVIIAILSAVRVQAQSNIVYADALGSGWADWSWGTTCFFTNTSPAYAGTASVKVVQSAWGGVSLHHTSIASNAYKNLEFYIHGGATGGQQLLVKLEDDNTGTSSASVNLNALTNAWKLISIPFASFQLSTPNFTRIDVVDRSGTAQPAYYLDSISLVQNPSSPPVITGIRATGTGGLVMYFDSVLLLPSIHLSNFGLISGNDANYSTRINPNTFTATTDTNGVTSYTLTFANNFINGGQYTLYINNVTNAAGTACTPDTSASFGFSNQTIQVNALAGNHVISPLIYGLAWAPSTNYLKDIGATVHRWGGNHTSTYNWQVGARNSANDWYFENSRWSDGTADSFISGNTGAGAQTLLTVPMLPFVAKDTNSVSFSVAKYGGQQATDPYRPDAGNGVLLNGTNVVNDPLDSGVTNSPAFQALWLAGKSPQFLAMDNEMDIWSSTHRDWHPAPVTYDEIWSTFSNYAVMVRQQVPNAKILGPVSCCWWYYWNSVAGDSDKAAHGGEDLLPWFLDRAHQHEVATGQRLLDVFDIHYYPDSFPGAADPARQLRSTRELWDPSYKSEGWIGSDQWATQTQPDRNYPQLIPRFKTLIAQHYPGLPLALTEYNWGGDTTLNGALALADALGIFGREDLYMACHWTAPAASSPAYQTFKLYRNFAGISCTAGTSDPNTFTAYAAKDPTNDALTVMVINKNPSFDCLTTIQLTGYIAAPTGQLWCVSSAGVSQSSITTNAFLFPAYSATLVRFTPSTADSDGDGFTDYQELLAGTDAHSSNSSLRITAIVPGQLTFTTVSNKSYQIEYCDALASNNWLTLTNAILGTGTPLQIIDPTAATATNRFYRVRLAQ